MPTPPPDRPDPDRDPDREVTYEELISGLRRFLRTDGRRYLEDPNIASVGLDYRAVEGRGTGELVVQFTVEGTCAVPDAVTLVGVRVPTDVRDRRAPPAAVTPSCPAGPSRPVAVSRSTAPSCPVAAERRGPGGAPDPLPPGRAQAARALL